MDKIPIPSNAKHVGYACHLPHSDEFLAGSERKPGIRKYVWAKTPALALIYDTEKEAEQAAIQHGKGLIVVELLENDDQFFVLFSE